VSATRIGLAILVLLLGIAFVLFLPAGRIDWYAAWVWLGIMLVGLLVIRQVAVKAHPDLPARRRTVGAGTPTWDRRILTVFRSAVLTTLLVSALDAGRYGWSSLPRAAEGLGVFLLVAGLSLFGISVVHNPFFESTVRIQSDVGHTVTSSGPYRVVRHPGYVALLLVAVGTPLVLGSAWALIPAGLAGASLLLRTAKEDRYLREQLAGYAEYSAQTRFRLIPWVW